METENREFTLIQKCWNDGIGEDMEKRCEICGLWKIEKTDQCPECDGIMDLVIEGLCLSWKCRDCDYGVATTANKLCFWDDKKYPKECYEKLAECPYGEK